MWWERNERRPLDRSWPAIIAYLGREPWREPQTLGAQLLAERRRRGLTIFEAGAAMGVSETTLWWWESSKRTPRLLGGSRPLPAVDRGERRGQQPLLRGDAGRVRRWVRCTPSSRVCGAP